MSIEAAADSVDGTLRARTPGRRKWRGGWLPAATWVQLQQLFDPDLVLEVELVARYPR